MILVTLVVSSRDPPIRRNSNRRTAKNEKKEGCRTCDRLAFLPKKSMYVCRRKGPSRCSCRVLVVRKESSASRWLLNAVDLRVRQDYKENASRRRKESEVRALCIFVPLGCMLCARGLCECQ